MFRTLIFIVCVVRAQFRDSGETNYNQNGWLEKLKRRLMSDNYDYQESSSDVDMRSKDNDPSKAPTEITTEATTTTAYDVSDKYSLQYKIDGPVQFVYDSIERNINGKADIFNDITTIHSVYAPHHRVDDLYGPSDPQNSIDEGDDALGISRNDLQISFKDSMNEDPFAPNNVSYKVIQPSLLSRRAGDAAPRFVEEVGANGVSLLSVDGAPFPEFQLPSARRQYQAARDSISEDWLD